MYQRYFKRLFDIVSATTLLVLIFSVCLMIYTNMYVLEAKNKEMSLLVFHGLTLKKMIFYQLQVIKALKQILKFLLPLTVIRLE